MNWQDGPLENGLSCVFAEHSISAPLLKMPFYEFDQKPVLRYMLCEVFVPIRIMYIVDPNNDCMIRAVWMNPNILKPLYKD